MAIKTVQVAGRRFKLGRKRPVAPCPMHRYAKYRIGALPTPPAEVSYIVKAATVLSQIYLNDQLGDCVIAMLCHAVGVWAANNGVSVLFAMQQVVELYSAIGGYVPSNPATDNGCDEQTAMNYWQQHGLFGHYIAGWLALDATNPTEVMEFVDLFENAEIGFEMPNAWVNHEPSASGFVWDVAGPPNPENGHAVLIAGYNSQGVIILTWGMWVIVTWPALAKYCVPSAGGNLYGAISTDQLSNATQKAPNGLDYLALVTDFDTMGGNVQLPPSPTPGPIVPPPPPAPGMPNVLTRRQAMLAAIVPAFQCGVTNPPTTTDAFSVK